MIIKIAMINKTKFFKIFQVLLILSIMISSINCNNSSNSVDDIVVDENSVPTAVNDTLTVDENSFGISNRIDVSSNDSIGKDGGSDNNFSLISSPQNGNIKEITDGIFEYTPNANFFGEDYFKYKISDIDGDFDTANVIILVKEITSSSDKFENMDPNSPSFVSIEDTTPSDKKWVKLESMSDEFDNWNNSKWFKSTWNYGVPVFMSSSSANSGVSDGKLWIRATLNENNPEGRWFQTARIHSRSKTFYPMYTEARIKAAHISAYNTYWLNNGDINNRDEIDIIENNSKPSCECQPNFPKQMNSQYFQADSSKIPNTIRNDGNFLRSDLSEANPLKNVGWNEDYHIFGVWWKDSKNIQFYLDGEEAGSVIVGQDRSGNSYSDREFTRNLEIIFDLWTNEADYLGGLPPKSELSNNSINTMRIDWVRTWKLENK